MFHLLPFRLANPPEPASDIRSPDSLAKAGLPDKLDRSFQLSLAPLNHDPVTIKVLPRKSLDLDRNVSDATVLDLLSDLAAGQYLIQSEVDAGGWTFTCTPRMSQNRSCLTLRTDSSHRLEWMENRTRQAGGGEQNLLAEFEEPKTLPSSSDLKRHKNCPPYLKEAYFSPSSKPLFEEVSQESRIVVAAYAYLCDLMGEPIADEGCLQALLKVQNILIKAHSQDFKIATIKEDDDENESGFDIRLTVQREAANSMVCIWLGEDFDRWDADEVTGQVAAEMERCKPSGLIEKLRRHEPDTVKARRALKNIVEMAYCWIGGAVACEEISSIIFYLYSVYLEEDEEIRKTSTNKHAFVEFLRKGISFRVDGWIGSPDNRTPVLSRHAYDIPRSKKETPGFGFRYEERKEFKALAEDIQELSSNLQSSPIIKTHFESSLEKYQDAYRMLRSQGDICGTKDFMPLPVLSNPFREKARQVAEAVQEPSTTDPASEALYRAARKAGLRTEPSTFSAIAAASKKLIAKMSVDYAEEFVQYVMSLEKIDASDAHELVNGWLASSRFKSWEVLDVAEGKEKSLLKRLAKAFESMDEDQVQPALGQLRRQLPFLLARHSVFFPEIVDMANRALSRLKPQSELRAEDSFLIPNKQLRRVLSGRLEQLKERREMTTDVVQRNAQLAAGIERLLKIAR